MNVPLPVQQIVAVLDQGAKEVAVADAAVQPVEAVPAAIADSYSSSLCKT